MFGRKRRLWTPESPFVVRKPFDFVVPIDQVLPCTPRIRLCLWYASGVLRCGAGQGLTFTTYRTVSGNRTQHALQAVSSILPASIQSPDHTTDRSRARWERIGSPCVQKHARGPSTELRFMNELICATTAASCFREKDLFRSFARLFSSKRKSHAIRANAASYVSRSCYACWNGCASLLIKASSDVPSTSSVISQQAGSIAPRPYSSSVSLHSSPDTNGLPLSAISTAFRNPR